jgi:hypothetical protein
VKRSKKTFISFRFEVMRKNWKRKENYWKRNKAKKFLILFQLKNWKKNDKLLEAKQSEKRCLNFNLVRSEKFEAK